MDILWFTVYPMKYVHGFVKNSFVSSVLMHACHTFIDTRQYCFCGNDWAFESILFLTCGGMTVIQERITGRQFFFCQQNELLIVLKLMPLFDTKISSLNSSKRHSMAFIIAIVRLLNWNLTLNILNLLKVTWKWYLPFYHFATLTWHWNPSSWKTRIYQTWLVNCTDAGDLAKEGADASAAMGFTYLYRNIPVSSPKRLMLWIIFI